MAIRVLHVLPHPGGGGETYIDLLERMPNVTHERCYLSAGRSPASAAVSVPSRWAKLARRLPEADLVHVHGDAAAIITSPLLGRRPSIVTTHGLHLWRRSTGRRRMLVGRLLAAALQRVRAVICTSESERAELEELVPRQVEKLRVILNGVDLPAPAGTEERTAARSELGVEPGTVVGLFVGQLESRKAPLLAARAAARVHEHGEPFVLLVAGDGPESDALRALAGTAVRPLGYRNDVARLLRASDIFVQPSEREGLSFGLLEAIACGLPVVAADGPGNPEAVGDAGVLIPAGDEDALVEALAALCQDAERRAALARAARDRARSVFSVKRFVAESHALYRETTSSITSAKAAAGAG